MKALDIDPVRGVWAAGAAPYEPSRPLEGDALADVAIIGGGFTGVSTAYHLIRRFPDRRIVLLEAKTLANGASGRNGGLMLNWMNGGVPPDDGERMKRVFDVTRDKLLQIPGVADAEVSLVCDPPWSREMMSEAARLEMGMF